MAISFDGPITHEQLVALGLDSATSPSFAVVDGKVVRANPRVRAVKLSVLLRREAAEKKRRLQRKKKRVGTKLRGGKSSAAPVGNPSKPKPSQSRKR